MMRTRPLVLILALVTAVAASALPAAGHNEGIPSLPLDVHNVEHVANLPNLVGNNIDWLERVVDGEVRRYLIAANLGNGFDVVDITEPTHPVTVGRYLLPDNDPTAIRSSSAGSNYHPWVTVNPRRSIVALTVEDPGGRTLRHNGGGGIQFVDISDVTNPRPLGKVDGLDGPHTVRMIGDTHAYTSLNTFAVDYTDAMNPTAEKTSIEGHEFWEDPNQPGTMWVGMATSVGRWGLFDITDPGTPASMTEVAMRDVRSAHEVYPAPDGSYVGIADFTTGQLDAECPGGGVHFYDISGRYVPGASLANPVDLGEWFAPFSGVTGMEGAPNNLSCTMHSWHQHPERPIALAGLYTGGTWIFDPSVAPSDDGEYTEYDGSRGTTTWGRTLGNVRDAADFVNAAQFLPFDLSEEGHERLFVVSGFERGVDIYRYTGELPQKLSDLEAAVGPDGAVRGTLTRFAVLGANGYEQLPIAGAELVVEVDGQRSTVVTDVDGSFSADVGAPPGATVTLTLPGDDVYAPNTVVVR